MAAARAPPTHRAPRRSEQAVLKGSEIPLATGDVNRFKSTDQTSNRE
jgi:hypothetical protein